MPSTAPAGQPPFLVNARFRRQAMTGVQRYADEICRRLSGDLKEIVPPINCSSGVRGHLWEQTSLQHIARREILWSPCNSGPLWNRKHVVTIHDMAPFDVPEGYSKVFRTLYTSLIPPLARRAARVLTVSEFSRTRIVEITGVDPGKVIVIPNGVSPFFRKPVEELPNAGQPHDDGDFLLAVGSLTPRKNLSGLIAAWLNLYRAGRTGQVQLFIVGGELTRVLGQHALDTSDGNGIRFLGRVDDERLRQLYHRALCCVNPSFYEGFGIPIVEALAAGCPVICSDRTAFPEVGGDVVEYFDPDDTESMMSVIDSVLHRSPDLNLRREQAERNRRQADRFDWDQSAVAVRNVLLEVALES